MKNDSSNTATATVTELPESVRIPLHSLQADLGYLIGRVIADGSCGPMIIQSMRERLDQIESYFSTRASSSHEALRTAWHPIETAPKDGKHFLARYRLVSDEEDEHGRVIKRGVIEHFTVVAYYVFGGVVEFPWRGTFVRNMTFTHWMPLPEPPALSDTERQP